VGWGGFSSEVPLPTGEGGDHDLFFPLLERLPVEKRYYHSQRNRIVSKGYTAKEAFFVAGPASGGKEKGSQICDQKEDRGAILVGRAGGKSPSVRSSKGGHSCSETSLAAGEKEARALPGRG